MARKRTRRAPTKLARAKAIILATTARTSRRSSAVQKRVTGANISIRTYRTARKQLGTVAVRRSRRGGKRGQGTWFTAKRGSR